MNKGLIERLRTHACYTAFPKPISEAADALEAADKRIAELEAQLSQTIAGFDVRQATRIGELLAEQNESERKLAKLESENAAQIAELHAISVALGTSEGHSSVQHIETLRWKLAVALVALRGLMEYSGIIEERCGDSDTNRAREALAQIGGDDAR